MQSVGGGMNELTVDFDNRIDVHGRYMACSGGWDWCVCLFVRFLLACLFVCLRTGVFV